MGKSEEVPFSKSRTKQYALALKHYEDPQSTVDNIMAIAQRQALQKLEYVEGLQKTRGLGEHQSQHSTLRGNQPSIDNSTHTQASPAAISYALEELGQIKTEIAGIEFAVDLMKGGSNRRLKHSRTTGNLTHSRRQNQTLLHTGLPEDTLLPSGPDSPALQALFPKSMPNKVIPATRQDATVLNTALIQLIPDGCILAKYQSTGKWGLDELDAEVAKTGTRLQAQGKAAKDDVALLNMVLKEVARQVGSNCNERADLIENVRCRYWDLCLCVLNIFDSMKSSIGRLQQNKTNMEQQAQQNAQRIADLRREVAELNKYSQHLNTTLENTYSEQNHYKNDIEDQLASLITDKQKLEETVKYLQEQLNKSNTHTEQVIQEATEQLRDEVQLLKDDRAELMSRLSFRERQLSKLKSSPNPTFSAAVQTDHIFTELDESAQQDATLLTIDVSDSEDGEREKVEQQLASTSAATLTTTATSPTGKTTKKNKKKFIPKNLGVYSRYITSVDKPGRVRSKAWVFKTLGQLFNDKYNLDLQDKQAQLDDFSLTSFYDYVHEWHFNRFGLKKLAEVNLLDLIVSVRAHMHLSYRIQLFADLCRLEQKPEQKTGGIVQDEIQSANRSLYKQQELDHLHFVLSCLQWMALPNTIQGMFPDSEDGKVELKFTKVCDVVRDALRWFDDGDHVSVFMSREVEPLVSPKGVLNVDDLLFVLVNCFQHVHTRNLAHLAALHRALDTDFDGFINQYDFFIGLRYLESKIPDKVSQQIFNKAVKPENNNLMPADQFVHELRVMGFVGFHLDYGAVYDNSIGLAADWPNKCEMLFNQMEQFIQVNNDIIQKDIMQALSVTPNEQHQQYLSNLYQHFTTIRLQRNDPDAAWLSCRVLIYYTGHLLSQSPEGDQHEPIKQAFETRGIGTSKFVEGQGKGYQYGGSGQYDMMATGKGA